LPLGEFELAILTQPTKFQTVVVDLEARFLGYSIIHRFTDWLAHIKNATALLTPEVIVVLNISIEPALGAGKF